MGKARNKYYAVWEGHETGVFEQWKDCEKAVKGYEGAKYKSFESMEAARQALKSNYWSHVGKSSTKGKSHNIAGNASIIKESLSVDAAWNTTTKYMEYQGVYTLNSQLIFHMGPLPDGTNNVGEFLAIVHALALCKQKNWKLPIYTDSISAMAWVRDKKIKTTLQPTSRNKQVFDLMDRALIWLKNNTWENKILKWDTENWGEIPADFGRK